MTSHPPRSITVGSFAPALGEVMGTAELAAHSSCGQLLPSQHFQQQEGKKEQPPPVPQPPAVLRAFPWYPQTCICVLLLLLVFSDRLLNLGPGDFAWSHLLGRLPLQLRVLLLQQPL